MGGSQGDVLPTSDSSAEEKRSNRIRLLFLLGIAILFPLLVLVSYATSHSVLSGATAVGVTPTGQGIPSPQPQPAYNSTLQQGSGQIFPQLNSQLFSFPGPLSLPTVNLVAVLISLAIVLGIVVTWKGLRLRRNRLTPFEDAGDAAQDERDRMASILQAAAAEIESGSPYRETVIRCYKLASDLLERRSEVKGKALTAREFKALVKDRLKIDSPYIDEVTALFEVARYSKSEITRAQSEAAVSCLSNLSEILKRPVVAVGGNRLATPRESGRNG